MSSHMENPRTLREKIKGKIWKGSNMLLPLISWINNYSKFDATADLISGITIGLIIIPQSVAYGGVVGLPAKVGLLSSVVGCIVYSALGTVKQVSVGPTAMMTLLSYQYINEMPLEVLGTFCFGCAIVGLILSIFRLGMVVEFIAIPVSSAFGSSVALTIMAQELRNFFGLNYQSGTFFKSLAKFASHVTEARPANIILGVTSVLLLIILDKLKGLPISKSWKHRIAIKKTLWLIGTSRNIIILLLGCLLTQYFEKTYGTVPYILIAPVTAGFPDFDLPWLDTNVNNVTITFQEKFVEMYRGMIAVPIVASLVHVSIAKCLDNDSNVRVSNELFSLSISNLFCSFFNSTPIAGAFSRAAVSNYCQVKTPISNIYTSLMVFSALTLLTPYFRFIPKASLSAVIVIAVFSVIDFKIILPLWRHSKKDLVVLSCTLISGLYGGIEIGLIMGVLVNVLFLIYLWARPSIAIKKCQDEYGDYVLVTPNLGLLYPAVNYMEMQLYRRLNKEPFKNLPVAVNCMFFKSIDYTAVKGMIRIVKVYQKRQRKIAFFNVSDKLISMCRDVDEIIADNFCKDETCCRLLLFKNQIPLRTIQMSRIVKESINICNESPKKPQGSQAPEDAPLLNVHVNRDRKTSL